MNDRTFPDPRFGRWECKDYADGWISFGKDRTAAEKYQQETGAMMRYVETFEVCGKCGSGDGQYVATAGGGAVRRCNHCGAYK